MIYSITLPNIKYGCLTPEEDAFLVGKNKFCVADGITRDPSSPKNFSNKKMMAVLKNYPNPSPATLAAKTFCKEFIASLEKRKNVKNSFITGNKTISELNKKHIKKVDYLVNDFYGCVASGGEIKNGKLFWGAITDCGIIIYNRNGKIKFQTPNWMKKFENYINKKNINWNKPATRKLIRSQYRNNPDKIIKGKCVAYGALTGEKEAEKFMHFGTEKIEPKDLIVFHTDGFEKTVTHKNFFKTILEKNKLGTESGIKELANKLAKTNYEKYGRERTLIATIYKP